MRSFVFFTHPDSSSAESSLPTGRQASLRVEREKNSKFRVLINTVINYK